MDFTVFTHLPDPYKPESNSINSGQVLQCPYTYEKGKLIVREMTDLLVLDLVDKGLVTDQMVLTVGYDIECLTNPDIRRKYHGPVTRDHYGREVPKAAHGSINLKLPISSTWLIMDAVMELYDRIVDKNLLVWRMYVVVNHVMDEDSMAVAAEPEQLDLFTDNETLEKERAAEEAALNWEKNIQKAMLEIKRKYGKNAILKGMNLEEAFIIEYDHGTQGNRHPRTAFQGCLHRRDSTFFASGIRLLYRGWKSRP